MNRIFVRPAQAGLEVPRALDIVPPYRAGQTIAADGEWVDHDIYIARRLRGGDLVEADPPPVSAPETASPPADAPPKSAKRSAGNPPPKE